MCIGLSYLPEIYLSKIYILCGKKSYFLQYETKQESGNLQLINTTERPDIVGCYSQKIPLSFCNMLKILIFYPPPIERGRHAFA